MRSLAEVVATLVMGASTATYAHFGVTIEAKREPPRSERVVERRRKPAPCPDQQARIQA